MKNVLLLALSLATTAAFAQINTPLPSPLGKVEQRVGLTDMSLEYSRPSMKDRKIFGELVPFNTMWRTGANASTKFTVSDPVKINGEEVPSGTYALYTVPGEEEWTIILHKNTNFWGTGGSNYNAEEDQLRFKVKPNTAYGETIETLTLNFANITPRGCDIELLWENTQVKFFVEVSYDDAVMRQIEAAMTIPAGTYFAAARYYLENDKDINKALEWINKAVDMDEKFWYLRQKSLILAKMERYDEAIAAAERSKELATKAENEHYVDLNTASIEAWTKKLKN